MTRNNVLLGHELCHAHQTWSAEQTVARDWGATQEGLSFKSMLDQVKVQYPAGLWSAWNNPTNYFEDFAIMCQIWYYDANGGSYAASIRNNPLSSAFATRYLPK